jgi:hypothetical protein
MQFNDRFFDDLGKSAGVVALVVGAAENVASVMRATAPVGESREHVDSIHVEVDYTPHRVVARVVADSDHSLAVEARTGHMARALASVKRG